MSCFCLKAFKQTAFITDSQACSLDLTCYLDWKLPCSMASTDSYQGNPTPILIQLQLKAQRRTRQDFHSPGWYLSKKSFSKDLTPEELTQARAFRQLVGQDQLGTFPKLLLTSTPQQAPIQRRGPDWGRRGQVQGLLLSPVRRRKGRHPKSKSPKPKNEFSHFRQIRDWKIWVYPSR